MTELDVDFARAQFPAFTDPEAGSVVHLENAGGSYVPSQVIGLLTKFFTSWKVQPYWDFAPSKSAGEAMDRARPLMAATFNAAQDEIHFGPSTSQNTYVLARALRPMWNDGDEIIVTNQDHEANVGSWRRLADTAMVVKQWSVDPATGLLDLADLDGLLTDRTRLVAVTHASNLAATVNPIPEIASRAHDHGAVVVVDGVSYAPHAAIDVGSLDCDVYLYSAYKTYGPHVGMMWTRRELLAKMTNQSHYFKAGDPTGYLTPAGPDHAVIAATAGIFDYYDTLYQHHFGDPTDAAPAARMAAVFELFGRHEEALMTPLVDYVVGRDDLRLIGTPSTKHDDRAPTVAFYSSSSSSKSIYEALVAGGVACGHGNFYSRRLVEALGLDVEDGVVRLSAVHYNTAAEIDQAISILDTLR